ncbi:protein KATNIP homolog isoform X2 [Octopus sinensis]|uniref:Protein KATNIP homolog isoform X2 n=1 Tax=Octopus sinensis TaxID=2607531 RepID=A0A7E6FNN1_9MOLL|nr:protein KATNIP homolog isoform X2 [Octopus sinensis]
MENSTGRVRKKWSDNPMNTEMPISASAVKEHINPQYEHYLLLLQQRNRMLRKLMTKTSQEISLERKEQGFTLYMNGANAEMDIHPPLPQLKSPSPNHEARSRRHRAAAQLMARRNRFFLDQSYLKELENDIQSNRRQRQAPLTKRSRKRWNIKSIKSRLAGMDEDENCRVSYEDDFESDDSLSSSDSEDYKDLINSLTEEECSKVQNLENKLNNNNYKQNQQTSPERKLTLSIADIKKLKVSLEMNSDLRKSIMEELSSGEESDCSIPEELNENDTNNSISGSVNLQQNFMKPADYIVLEFGTPSRSWEKNVVSSKQKDYNTRSTTEFTSHDRNTSLPGLKPENKISNDFIKFQLLDSSNDADHNHNQTPKQSRKHHSQFESHSGTLTEQQVNLITKNVLRMRPRQQVNLMKMLGKLEETADTEISERHQETGKEHQNLAFHPHRKVRLELLSNWGHNKRIGLTEIQLYDTSGKIIPVLPENVTVKNASNPSNSILVVFNGKAKTSKLKNMWSCDRSDTAPVMITIHHLAEKNLSKIKLWNYNHSLKDLNIGVNLIKVFINDKLLYSGSVEKGCGNHIFDFSTSIELGVSSNNRSSSPSLESLPLSNNNNLTRRNSIDSDLAKALRKRDTASSAPNSRCPSRGRKRSISLSPLSPPLSAGHPVSRKHNLPLTNSHGEVIDDSKDLSFSLLTSKKPSSVKSKSPCPSRKTCSPRPKFNVSNQKDPWDVLFSENDKNSSPKHSPKLSLDNTSANGIPVSPRTHRNTANLDAVSDATRTTGKKERKSKDSLDWLENDILPKHLHCHDNHTSNCSRGSNMEPSSNYQEDIVDRLEEPLKDFQLSSPSKNGKLTPFDSHSLDEELETAHQSTIRLRNMLDKIERHVSLSSRSGSSQDTPEPSSPGSVTSLHTILDEEFQKNKCDSLNEEMQEQEFGMYTPMQKIQKRRAKWRHLSESNLEESWGSLNYFNHLHRGRLSMDGDALDEYLLDNKVPVFQSEFSTPENQQAVMQKADENFTIPELPYGQELVINIKTTWGDKHYVGLTGIDIFSEKGESVTVKKITASPKDINVLPQYNKDPRVVQNLIDGVNRTRDDVHMWLTPFTAGSDHYVTLTFTEPCHIALIRIWNYNKSRIHSFRGARELDILLDRRLIFSGEIARACGGVEGGTEAFGDTILFSVEEEILEAVSRNDDAYEGETLEDISWEDEIGNQRPTTAAQANNNEDRPFTQACGNDADLQDHMSTLDLMDSLDNENSSVLKGKCLTLNFTETWGDLHYLGLTGLEIFSTDKETLPVNMNMLSAEPSDLHSLPGHEQDERTLDKLINGVNVTNSDENMWLIPFTPEKPHIVSFEFPQPVTISGIRVWNYNKNPEDTYRGAKIVHVEIDGHTISPPDGYLLRKGLGSCPFDFGQEISFSSTGHLSFGSKSPNAVKDRRCLLSEQSSLCYETVSMPCGFIYQLQLFSTWGDPYYVGLNGIELYDAEFYKIPLDESHVAAYPDSVNVLTPNVQSDIRTPDKLVDGENDTKDGAHMWLAPVLPSVVNKVYIVFDQPTTVSMIKIWNYRKTPSRAAKDIALLVDDLLVCNGSLPAVNNASRGILPTCDMPHPYHTLLFTENKEVLKKERHTVISNYTPLTQGQEIQMTNDRKVVTFDNSSRSKQQNVNQAMRPTTCVTSPANKRPY